MLSKNSQVIVPIKIKKDTNFLLAFYDGYVAAGFPSPAENYSKNSISLDYLLIKNPPATFMIKVLGDSMSEKQINQGDIAIVDRSLTPKNGDIVLAIYNGEFTLKELEIAVKLDKKTFKLIPANPKYKAIEANGEDELVIWGVVTNVIHSLLN